MLTVVIPVFNAQDTLDRCVASVVRQEVDGLHVILVDDGSTDASPRLCDNWAEKDERISVIHQENAGLSAARNKGIERTKTAYITFVDADDFLQDNTYEPLMHCLCEHPDCQILEFPVFVHFGDENEYVMKFQNQTFDSFQQYWIDGEGYRHTFAWNKVYRTDLFQKVKFPVGMTFEDIHTLPLLFEQAGSITTTNSGLYYYCHNQQGITVNAAAKDVGMLLDGHLKVIDKYSELIKDDNYYMEVLNIQLHLYQLTGQPPVIPIRKFDQPKAFQQKSFRWKARILNAFGLKTLCRFMKIAHR